MATITFTALGLSGTDTVRQTAAAAFDKIHFPSGASITLTDTTTLTNPANSYYPIAVNASGKQINMMPMNLAGSPDLGSILTFDNSQASTDPVDLYLNDGSIPIYFGLLPSQNISIMPVQNVTTNGAFKIISISTVNSTFPTTASGAYTATQDVSVKYNYDKEGGVVTLNFPATIAATSVAAQISLDDLLPTYLRPSFTLTYPVSVQNNSAQVAGICTVDSSGSITFGNGVANGNFTGSGNGGFYGISFTYNIAI